MFLKRGCEKLMRVKLEEFQAAGLINTDIVAELAVFPTESVDAPPSVSDDTEAPAEDEGAVVSTPSLQPQVVQMRCLRCGAMVLSSRRSCLQCGACIDGGGGDTMEGSESSLSTDQRDSEHHNTWPKPLPPQCSAVP